MGIRKALARWYRDNLGLGIHEWGGAALRWGTPENPNGSIAWSLSDVGTTQFEPGTASFTVNYRVDDLASLLQSLQVKGCTIASGPEASEYGKFGLGLDPEDNKVELWEPPAGACSVGQGVAQMAGISTRRAHGCR